MGYDFTLASRENECLVCHRSDNTEIAQSGCTFNHSWAFYQFLDEESGLRWIYGKPLETIIPALEDMLECLEHLNYWQYNYQNTSPDIFDMLKEAHGLDNNVQMDGWAAIVGNAYLKAKEILETSKATLADGYRKATWYGD